jgi:hypothetical protein
MTPEERDAIERIKAGEIYQRQAEEMWRHVVRLELTIESIKDFLSINPKFLPLLEEITSLFPPITTLDLFGVSEEQTLWGESFLSATARYGIEGIITSLSSPYKFLEDGLNRFIIDTQSDELYKRVLEIADEFTKSRLKGEYFDNFSDDKKLKFFHKLALTIHDFLAENGIEYKDIDDEKLSPLKHPVFFNPPNARKIFVCLHYATLQNAIIEDLIEKYKLPIKVFSFLNYFVDVSKQGFHQNIIITDLDDNILAIVERNRALKPSKPTNIAKLLKDRVIYRVADGEVIDAACYLLYNLRGNKNVGLFFKLTPDSEWEPIEKLTAKFEQAKKEHAQQQGQPSPSVNPETPNNNKPTHK